MRQRATWRSVSSGSSRKTRCRRHPAPGNGPSPSRAFITPSMMFQTGPIRSTNPASSPTACGQQPVPFRGLGGGHHHLHTLGRRERAGDPVVDVHSGALALVPLTVLLETCMQAALAQPHIHHQIIDHKRIDAGNAGALASSRRTLARSLVHSPSRRKPALVRTSHDAAALHLGAGSTVTGSRWTLTCLRKPPVIQERSIT
jgi:hypothetical protein